MKAATKTVPEVTPAEPWRRLGFAAAALGLAALVAAATDVQISGNWQGVFLLRGAGERPLVLKDDLFLGDGSRLVLGASFSRIRRVVGRDAPAPGRAWLELDWDDGGSGLVRNHLADGTELVTLFSRYADDEGKTPRGLFVGGALPDVAAVQDQDESGMAFRDARGWHHIWCNVNELLLDLDSQQPWPPGSWKYLGARVLIRDPERVVIESSHEVPVAGGSLRIDRFAYFRAGKPWFKLGVRVVNTGERPARYAYAYGDEPWVGHFGSAAGNVGWLRDAIVRVEGPSPSRRTAGRASSTRRAGSPTSSPGWATSCRTASTSRTSRARSSSGSPSRSTRTRCSSGSSGSTRRSSRASSAPTCSRSGSPASIRRSASPSCRRAPVHPQSPGTAGTSARRTACPG